MSIAPVDASDEDAPKLLAGAASESNDVWLRYPPEPCASSRQARSWFSRSCAVTALRWESLIEAKSPWSRTGAHFF